MVCEPFLARQKSLHVLFIGAFAYNDSLTSLTQQEGHTAYHETNEETIFKIAITHKIDLIFGSLSFGEKNYFHCLSEIRQLKSKMTMVLFLQPHDTRQLYSVLSLQCKQYLSLEAERDKAVFHLKAMLYEKMNENIFLKDTQYLEALLDSSVVSQSNIDGNITYINENFTKITGYMPEEVIGKSHRILRHPSNDVSIFKNMWETITRGDVWRERILNINKDGTDFWADTIIIPFKDSQTGKILQYLAVRRDITQMLLEKRAAMEQERKAQEQFKLSEAKDSFLILFTHELKTPLNAIINFSYYLHRNMHRIEEIPKIKREYLLSQIYNSATLMLENVTNILDLSKLRHHKLDYHYSFFDVKASVEEVIENHQALATEFKHTILFHDDGERPFMQSDPYRFQQILANIISNAIKYGTSQVIISLQSTPDKIEISVDDDGLGINDKEVIFELYEQSMGGLTNMEKRGTGIGLHFVKLLCDGLDFKYSLQDSTILGGTRFVVYKLLKEVHYD